MNTKETNNQNQSEETVMINKNINDKKENTVMENNEVTAKKTSVKNEKAAYAVGGFAAGLASGVAGSSLAANTAQDDEKEEVIASAENAENITTETVVAEEQAYITPEPEDVLLATDEGVRIAQVDDKATFAEAFADARAQVGPGGAFEWRGHVYNTYYAEEWNNMSAEERAEYQSKIDYTTIAGDTSQVVEENPYVEQNPMASNTEMVDNDSDVDGGVKVLGVEAVEDEYGNQMTVAVVEAEGEQALLVDVDNDGSMDALMVDENYDNQIDPYNEIYDIEDCNIETNDLIQMSMQQNEVYYASNDNLPDYMNDADISTMA